MLYIQRKDAPSGLASAHINSQLLRSLLNFTSQVSPNYPNHIRAKHVARFLNCSQPHVYNLVQQGALKRIRIGSRSFAYDPIDVLLFSINGYSRP